MKGLVASLVLDRRSAPRHNLQVPLFFRTHESMISEWKNVAEPKNISETGLLFSSDSRLALGARIDVLMEINVGINGSQATSRVCWSGEVVRLEPSLTPGTRDIAVKFMCYEVLHPNKMPAVANSF